MWTKSNESKNLSKRSLSVSHNFRNGNKREVDRSWRGFDLDAREDVVRPVPDRDFEVIQLEEYLYRSVKIGVGLHLKVRTILIEFLQDNAKLFAITPNEILDIDPNIACHHLNVDAKARYVS